MAELVEQRIRDRPVEESGVLDFINRELNQVVEKLRRVMNRKFKEGTGSPEGVVTAPVGTLYTDTSGTPGSVLWVKETGDEATGWSAK